MFDGELTYGTPISFNRSDIQQGWRNDGVPKLSLRITQEAETANHIPRRSRPDFRPASPGLSCEAPNCRKTGKGLYFGIQKQVQQWYFLKLPNS